MRRRFRSLLARTPLISDFYRHFWAFSRHSLECRGVYRSFDDASSATPRASGDALDKAAATGHSIPLVTTGAEIGVFRPADAPVIECLAQALCDGSTVFDLGGNVGVAYYAYAAQLSFPSDLRWLVCELPQIVEAGRVIARERGVGPLSFTTDFGSVENYDTLFTAGTLQYLPDTLATLLSGIIDKPRHLIIQRVPVCDGPSFVTVQNAYYGFFPYRIESRTAFIRDLEQLGYVLKRTWGCDRTLRVPFDRRVARYCGFHFVASPVT